MVVRTFGNFNWLFKIFSVKQKAESEVQGMLEACEKQKNGWIRRVQCRLPGNFKGPLRSKVMKLWNTSWCS